ncbi:hypothetical protein M0804_013454 [Polistes exclamans]|nr:hypothetical protein M0804_013454 [Polistes exclamans]
MTLIQSRSARFVFDVVGLDVTAVLQINLNHARRAQELMQQQMAKTSVVIAIIAEPWIIPEGDERWFSLV